MAGTARWNWALRLMGSLVRQAGLAEERCEFGSNETSQAVLRARRDRSEGNLQGK